MQSGLFERLRALRFLRRPAVIGGVGCACGFAIVAVWLFTSRNFGQRLPFYETSQSGAADHWKAFGGTWEIANGAMRNESTERGAKLITGSPSWTDYSMDADLELLGPGDAGVIVRVSDAEAGVDSYTGYYVGLRTLNSTFFIGKANHGWHSYPETTMDSKVEAFQWYHMHVTVVGCQIAAKVTSHSTGESKTLRLTPDECFSAGQVGLRSYSSGGVWRNIAVTAAKGNNEKFALARADKLPIDDRIMLARNIRGSYLQTILPTEDTVAPDRKGTVQPIGNLRLLASHTSDAVTIRGTVILSTPGLYVQDSTGGVLVSKPHGPPLKVGDEVEVQGQLAAAGFHSVLRDASVQLLWEGEPPPPFAVTLNQAASGAYDSTFVEVDALLTNKKMGPEGNLLLEMEGRSQAFQAIMNPGRSSALFRKLSTGSTLRLRGICVADSRYTGNLKPFALLIRSVEDVQLVAGPPWWSWYFILRILVAGTVFALVAYVLYLRARNWRMGAVLEERGRLAHEIHDTLAQSFAGIGFQLQAIQNRLPDGDALLKQQVDLACSLVRHSHEETRRSIATLRKEAREECLLDESLSDCARRMVGPGSLPIRITTRGQACALPLCIENALVRIGQEATANAVSHAHASAVNIAVFYARDSVMLTIEDDGVGFDQTIATDGFGLAGMRRRAASIGAAFTIVSNRDRGTRIEVSASLPKRKRWSPMILNSLGSAQRDSHSYR